MILTGLIFGLLSFAQNPNTAVFPNRFATDNDLFVAKDLASSVLATTITSSQLTIPVIAGSVFASPSIVTIDNETISICSISSNTLNVCSGGRGFNGTIAVSHLAGKLVYAGISSYYFNQLSAETKSLEQYSGTHPYNPKLYNFAPQSLSNSVVSGVNSSLTLSPCPSGIIGDSNSNLYINDGGSSEPVLITSLTGVSPSTSCVIFFTPSNNHSTSATISSATNGMQETVNALRIANATGLIQIDPGIYYNYGPVKVIKNAISFACANVGTVINQMVPNSSTLQFIGDNQLLYGSTYGIIYNTIQGCQFSDNVSTSAGDVITFSKCLQCTVRDSFIVGGYTGIHSINTYTLTLDNVYIENYKFWGLLVSGSSTTDLRMAGSTIVSSNAGNGCVEITNLGSGAIFSHDDFFECGTVAAMLLNTINSGDTIVAVDIINTYLDTCVGPGLQIAGQGATSLVHVVDGWSNGNLAGIQLATTGSGTIKDFQWSGGRIAASQKWGILTSGNVSQINITNTQIGANSMSNPNTFPNIDIGSNISDVTLANNRIAAVVGESSSVSAQGVLIEAGAGDRISIQGNTFQGDTTAISNSATGTHNIILNNIGYP